MKTKLFFFTSLLLLSIATATAQTKEKGFFVEMNGGYGEVKTAFVSSTVENPLLFHLGYARYAVLTPSIGYQINRHWAAGFKIQFESIMEDEKRTTYTPYMRYNFLHPVKFNIFMDMQVSAIRHLGKNDVEGGINPGASYALNNHFSILLKYLFIGFNGEDRKSGVMIKSKNFIIDANWRRLQLGLQYIF